MPCMAHVHVDHHCHNAS